MDQHDKEQLNTPTSNGPSPNAQVTSTGLDENVAALLAYSLGFVTGLIFILLEKSSRFVRFHAMQSLVTFLAFFVAHVAADLIPFLDRILRPLVDLFAIAIWVVCMVKAYQQEMFRLPIAAEIADSLLKSTHR